MFFRNKIIYILIPYWLMAILSSWYFNQFSTILGKSLFLQANVWLTFILLQNRSLNHWWFFNFATLIIYYNIQIIILINLLFQNKFFIKSLIEVYFLLFELLFLFYVFLIVETWSINRFIVFDVFYFIMIFIMSCFFIFHL